MGSFKKSCLTNWEKVLKFVNFENGHVCLFQDVNGIVRLF